MGSHAFAQHPSEAAETPWPGAWFRSSALAERLLCHARIVYLENSPCFGQPILFEVKPPTGEPYPGDPELRFGGRGGRVTGPPYPYPERVPKWRCPIGLEDTKPDFSRSHATREA